MYRCVISYRTTEESATEESTFDVGFLTDLVITAEKGIAFLSNFLEIPTKKNETTTISPVTSTAQETSQRRAPKNVKHPNQL